MVGDTALPAAVSWGDATSLFAEPKRDIHVEPMASVSWMSQTKLGRLFVNVVGKVSSIARLVDNKLGARYNALHGQLIKSDRQADAFAAE